MSIPTTTANKVATIAICGFVTVFALSLTGLVVGFMLGIQAAWGHGGANDWGIEQTAVYTVLGAVIGVIAGIGVWPLVATIILKRQSKHKNACPSN